MTIKLYKIPGFYIAGFFGPFGSGKSLALLEYGLELANFLKLPIVCNFGINELNVRKYCYFKGLSWFAACSRIIVRKDVFDFFCSEDSVLLFDEAGVELFSRDWVRGDRKTILDKIFRIRHYGNKLLYAAQDRSQVDKQLRDRSQLFIWCRGFSINNKLISRSLFFFDPITFDKFDEKYQAKWIYPIWASGFRFDWSNFSLKEKMLFNCFNSFDRPSSEDEKYIRIKNRLKLMTCLDGDSNNIDYSLYDDSKSQVFNNKKIVSGSFF